jgi:hypothetical protein
MKNPVNFCGLSIIEIEPSKIEPGSLDFVPGEYVVEDGTKLHCDACGWEGDSSELIVEELPVSYEQAGDYKYCTTCPSENCQSSTGPLLHIID